MSKEKPSEGTYDVGYGKPPKAHQFKPGTSGNPKGRPKGPGDIHKTIARHARRKVHVIENGEKKKMARMDVDVSAIFNKASKGDGSAARLLTSLIISANETLGREISPSFSDADVDAILAESDWQSQLASLREENADDE